MFDVIKNINFEIDYYSVLNIEKNTLIVPKTKQEKEEVANILSKAYRNKAKLTHPDFGGSESDFKLVVQAHTILSDPILRKVYDSRGEYMPVLAGDGNVNSDMIDWDKIGNYRQGTIADTIGYDLFFKISEYKNKLDIIPAFKPSKIYDSYEWDWVLMKTEEQTNKLALSIVPDEEEVLRLTTTKTKQDYLPFKIYVCIPRLSMEFFRKNVNSSIQHAVYSDYSLLETTSLETANEYIKNQFENDIMSFYSGELVNKQQKKDIEISKIKWMNSQDVKQHDIDVLRAILLSKTFIGKEDERAADFLDNLPDDIKD